MAGRNVVLSHEDSHRRDPLLPAPPDSCATFKEVAGGITAECAAVCCCCPCGIVELLVVVMYKLPKGICRRATRSWRRRRMLEREMMVPGRNRCQCGCEETDFQIHSVGSDFDLPDLDSEKWEELEQAAEKIEKEIRASFDGMGFWRSPSRTESEPKSPTIETKQL